ncbi:aspartyl protease family protein [Candidatus Woesebacteria bacterium]|nr:aspartyl protease family protein [Candidatus Woesebacteria bacterium]
MSADDDKKFLPKVTVPYSPTIFGVKMPLIQVSFDGIPLPVASLLDSGATNSMLHPRIASSVGLKIDYSKKYVGTGAGGSFDYVKSGPIKIQVLGQRYDIEFDIPLDENFAWPCILGHNSIFKFSKIVFKTYKQEFDIFFRNDIN